MNECFAEKNSSMIENRSFKSGFVNHAAAVFFRRFSEDSEEPYDALFTSHLFFLFLNHLFDHIAADGTSLCGGQVSIVALA